MYLVVENVYDILFILGCWGGGGGDSKPLRQYQFVTSEKTISRGGLI